jgi:membrane-associated phospholipid phosphatase
MKPTGTARFTVLTIVIFLSCQKDFAQDSSAVHPQPTLYPKFERPEKWAFVRYQPADLWNQLKAPFLKKNLPWTAALAGSTALLIHFDQKITDGINNASADIHFDSRTRYKNVLTLGTTSLFKVPTNINSAFYQLGEGWVGMAVAGGLFIHSRFSGSNQSAQAASDLTEGFIATAISTQLIKRVTGRESPSNATTSGGAWRPFPSFAAFQKHTSTYDAYPSGHLATMMTYVTILAEDFPEKKWIKPVGYSLMGCTALAMVNNKVHWVGDYPLALAIGYLNGKFITDRHKRPKQLKTLP